MPPLIKADTISVIRDGKTILDQVSIDIDPLDFITIVGPNGAGKSMLLKCLMGFYPPDKGRIIRSDALQIGYVPQRIHAEPSLPISVNGFLKLKRQNHNNAHGHRNSIEQIADETNIRTLLPQPLHILSGGELQRVLLARALLQNPELLILDEPAQNLDISGQLAFYTLLERVYTERQLSIVMVSHDLHLVMASTQKVICLYHHICCSGTPQAVTQDPEFISLFGHDMSKLMAMYQHSHNHSHDHSLDASLQHCDHG